MKPPCDASVIQSSGAAIPCPKASEPWILAVAILGSSMAFIDGTVVNVALPALQTSLGGTVIDMQWVVEAYALFLGALILVGGSMGDLLGRRRMFLAGVTVFGTASAACGLAPDIHFLVAARAIQGIGAAFLVPGSLSIISVSFGEKDRGRAIGTWSGFTAITTGLGPVLGGWLIDHASWRWVFFINLPVAAVVIALSLLHVPESRSAGARKIDWAGATLATLGLGGVAYGFIESVSLGWSNPSVWGTLAGGCVSLILFLLVEARADSPMVPLELFRFRNFKNANLLTLCLYAALGIFFVLFPLDLIQVQHYSATATGAATLPFILLMFLLSRWSGGLVTRYGPRLPLVVGPLIAAAGFVLLALPAGSGTYWTTFFPAFVVLGVGMAISVAPLTTVVMASVAQDRAGSASGINNAVARVAGLLAIAVLGIAMFGVFSFSLNRNLATLQIPASIVRELQSNEIRLAAMPVPQGLDAHLTYEIRASIERAFLSGFRIIMLTSAVLSAGAAIFGLQMMPVETKKTEK